MNKVILITNIPNPYRIPLFNELNLQLEREGMKLKVIFGALSYPRRKWKIDMSKCKFDYEVLSSHLINSNNSESPIFSYKGLLNIILKENPSVIVTPAFSVATTKIWFLSLFKKLRYIIWSGAIFSKARNKYIKESFLRKVQRKILIKRATAFIAYGIKAKNYLISYGADPGKIKIGINTVDVNYFKTEVEKIRSNKKSNEEKILLYVGHLVKGKRVDLLFQAIKLLKDKRKDFILKIVGDGPEYKYLNNLAKKFDINGYVRFEGFKQKSELVNYLAEADCFLFPTEYDIWGLVLIEAMVAGLPCISSIYAGATYDLIKDGVNGFVLDFFETNKLVEKINWILNNPLFAKEMGQKARKFIEKKVTIEKSANGFLQAIDKILQAD